MLLEVNMTEAEMVFHKKKKNKKQLLEEVAEPGNPHETTTTGVNSQKKHKHKKKKTKSEKDDCRPVEGLCDTREGQNETKRKHDAENVSVTQEAADAADAAAAQEREVKKKKKKKRRIEEPDRPGGNTEAEAALTAVQTNLEPVPQTRVKRKAKVRKTHTQPAADAHSPTDARLHPDDVLDIDEATRQEILEFLPNFTFGHVVTVHGAIKYDLPRFRVYKKQGIPLRTGRFTAAENKQLKQNVKDFLDVSGIDSEFKLFRPQRFPDEKGTIRRLKRELNFLRSLCAGIPRSWNPILHRAGRFFNRENYKGRFTEDENKVLKELYMLHGSNWTTISDKMGRSCEAVQRRFNVMCENHGAWSEAELKVLLTCLHQQLLKRAEPGGDDGSAVIQKMDLYKKLAWVRVAKQVQTRSSLQCRVKWMTYLMGKMKTGGKIHGRKSIEGQIQLIKVINEMAVEETGDIVWDDLTHLFGNTTPFYLQMKFHQLKVTYIPDWNRKSFCDIIDFLYEKTLPKLEEDLKGCEDAEEPAETRQSYKLSEIFPNL
ncbi:transcription termination factor 1-like isoform X2 [Clupea harengus]|uniref:Transcription termination factor 1-like isoform X2 n=1 Tax=Clupea harengus TaxID=7950 RepID=A0A6P8GKY8_CLUHA|nr:transcription termination factor 1-like isoform X2 [Clupea harengus]